MIPSLLDWASHGSPMGGGDRDRFDLHEEFGAAKPGLHAGAGGNRIETAFCVESIANRVERRVVLKIRQIASGSHHVVPVGALTGEQRGEVRKHAIRLRLEVALVDGAALLIHAGCAGKEEHRTFAEFDAHPARERHRRGIVVGLTENPGFADRSLGDPNDHRPTTAFRRT